MKDTFVLKEDLESQLRKIKKEIRKDWDQFKSEKEVISKTFEDIRKSQKDLVKKKTLFDFLNSNFITRKDFDIKEQFLQTGINSNLQKINELQSQ